MSKPSAVITTLEDSAPWIDQQLVSAYLRTTYRVLGPPVDLRIGQLNKSFNLWLAGRQIGTFTFITAWNPYSHVLPTAENERRNRALEIELQRLSVEVLPALGVGDDTVWSPEASFCALGLPASQALRLGREYEQNALVYGRSGHVPELWWLPAPNTKYQSPNTF